MNTRWVTALYRALTEFAHIWIKPFNGENHIAEIKKRTEEALINNITSAGEWKNNQIVFLLGAGCSRSSGIPGAHELASRWLRELPSDKAEEFLKKNEPIAQYYFDIFSARFLPIQRKAAIEAFTKTAYPGIGYTIFAKMLHSADKWGSCNKEERFKTILTTNFDNLIEQAFVLFTPERPLVIPDPSLIGFLKDGNNISVVKVHGDSRYAPLNEKQPTEKIPKSVQKAISERIDHGVLVVLGYAGAENGVAQLISQLVSNKKIEQIWWVASELPTLPKWQELAGKFDGFHFVQVVKPDFDGFMLKLKQKAENVSHVSATQMDEHIYKYHESLMWRLGLYGNDGRLKIKISEKHFSDYFHFFARAAHELEDPTKKDNALQILEDGLKKHSQSANYNILLGAFYKTIMNDKCTAIEFLRKATDLAPEHSGARAELANALKESPSAMDKNICGSIIADFDKAEKLDPQNINNILNYAGFLLAQPDKDANDKGREKLRMCEPSLYEPVHRMELAFYAFAHNIGGLDIPERLEELKTYLSDGKRSPDFYLGWNVEKAKKDKHPDSGLVEALDKAINSDPSESIRYVLDSIDAVLTKRKATS